MLAVWVELQHGSATNPQTLVQRLKELAASFEGIIILVGSHTEPLDGGYADCTIKHTWTKFPSLSDVNLPKPALRAGLSARDLQHVSADVDALPKEPVLVQCLPGES